MKLSHLEQAKARADVLDILDDVESLGSFYELTDAQLADALDRLEAAGALITGLLESYDTSDTTTAKFWTSATIAGAGLIMLDATDDASLLLTLLGGMHALWCGWDLGHNVIGEQVDLGFLEQIAMRIDAVEIELIRRGR